MYTDAEADASGKSQAKQGTAQPAPARKRGRPSKTQQAMAGAAAASAPKSPSAAAAASVTQSPPAALVDTNELHGTAPEPAGPGQEAGLGEAPHAGQAEAPKRRSRRTTSAATASKQVSPSGRKSQDHCSSEMRNAFLSKQT